MEEIRKLFREYDNGFTIYAVDKSFVSGIGLDYFKSFQGKPNYISSDNIANKKIKKIYAWIGKKIPIIGDLLKIAFSTNTQAASIVDVIVALQKLFISQEHQAVGPEVIDPIIIEEEKVYQKNIEQLIYLHKDTFLFPTIIIILMDNNIERAKKVFSNCPNDMNIKFVLNSGKYEMHRVINVGASNVRDFFSAFSHQCFCTCSKTKHDVLLNAEWEQDSIVRRFAPLLLKYRSNLICDEKREIVASLDSLINDLENMDTSNSRDNVVVKNFLCIAKIFRVYCKDDGGTDIKDAFHLANFLQNDILLAYVYKYAYFFSQKNFNEQEFCLNKAYDIFKKNNMMDNAIYCKNNQLVRQFDTSKICADNFSDLLGEAINSVPGLVGMPHLFNNTGLAYLLTGNPEQAKEYLDKGIAYSKTSDRLVQRLAIQCNKLIVDSYYEEKIEFAEINKLMKQILDGMYYKNELHFISARYAMNVFIIALRQNISWGKELLRTYPIIDMINKGLSENTIGSGQLLKQLEFAEKKLPGLLLKDQCITPVKITEVTGRREYFISNFGLNPFYLFTWL